MQQIGDFAASKKHKTLQYLKAPPTQKSIFAQERPNGLKFSGYVGPKADSL